MEQLKLGNGDLLDLPSGGVMEMRDDKLQVIISADTYSFSQIEVLFGSEANTSRLEVLDTVGDIMDVKRDYTRLDSIKKQNDYVMGREEVAPENEGDPIEYKDITGTVYIIILAKPDLRDRVKDLQETVDFLVLEGLGV